MNEFKTLNLTQYCLENSTKKFPHKCALQVYTDNSELKESWTFTEINRAILGVAAYFSALELPSKSRILLRIGNSSDFPMVFLGVIAAGFVPIPTSSMLTAYECDFLLKDSNAAVIVHDDKTELPQKIGNSTLLGADEISEMKSFPVGNYVETTFNDPAFLVYTSGTSGRPKGVLHAHRSLLGRKPMYNDWYGISDADILLHAGAFNWTYTLGTGLLDPWVNGATSIIYAGKPDPEIWPIIIEKSGATLFAAVPSLYRRILKYSKDLTSNIKSLRHGLSAGESLSVSLLNEWNQKTGKPLYEALGMSEISTYISSGPTIETQPGSPGKPQQGRQVKLLPIEGGENTVAVGEKGIISIHKSETGLMLGYLNSSKEDENAYRGEWFLTGDTGYFDEDGYIWYTGRVDDLMNASGYRVSPLEVENVISDFPDILEVSVGQKSLQNGVDVITAYLVVSSESNFDLKLLADWCAERLASYKCPRRFVFVESLPRTITGKVIKKQLIKSDSGLN